MNIPPEVKAVGEGTLSYLVRCAEQSATIEVRNWEVQRLGGGYGNPVSLGLYRFAGNGTDRGTTVQWSLVLKMIQSPANVGDSDMGEGDDQSHWNYWKREKYVYQSGILDDLPSGFRAPRCFAVEEHPGDIIWLWLEEVADVYGGKWSLERYGLAARHLGRFNGRYVMGQSLPRHPWLSVGLLHQWCAAFPVWAPRFSEFQWRSSLWDDFRIRRLFPELEKDPLLRLIQDREQFISALDGLPQTFCHKDAYPTNLMACQSVDGEEETVALDWALAGVGPLGEELAQLALGALNQVAGAEAVDVRRAVLDGYLAGLSEVGWQGSADAVRFGFAACTALRMGLMLLWTLERVLQKGTVDESSTFEQGAKHAGFAAELAEEAYELLPLAM